KLSSRLIEWMRIADRTSMPIRDRIERNTHNCYDNAPMESFWGTLKNESLSHYRFNNRDEAISVIREYIEIFYNRQRRHSRLGNISPAAFREKYHQMAA
ncbi:IS3 family transposase, partial [Shigella sonnei]